MYILIFTAVVNVELSNDVYSCGIRLLMADNLRVLFSDLKINISMINYFVIGIYYNNRKNNNINLCTTRFLCVLSSAKIIAMNKSSMRDVLNLSIRFVVVPSLIIFPFINIPTWF